MNIFEEKCYCPECDELVQFIESTCEPHCEDCGNHDGTRCPECDRCFDHVWGYDKIEGYQESRKK